MDPTAPGMFGDRPVYDVDIQALAEKNWRRPGSDLSDWFNYGFDEISWEAYCIRRRDLNALGTDLKGNVLVRCRLGSGKLAYIKRTNSFCRILLECPKKLSQTRYLRRCVPS